MDWEKKNKGNKTIHKTNRKQVETCHKFNHFINYININEPNSQNQEYGMSDWTEERRTQTYAVYKRNTYKNTNKVKPNGWKIICHVKISLRNNI